MNNGIENRGSWTQCVAVATGLAALLTTQVMTAWALSALLIG